VAELLSELLERCRRAPGSPGPPGPVGDAEAAAELVRRFEGMAHDLAGALTGDAHLAQDAVQAAFVRALSSLGDLRDDRAFPGWFRQIVRTEAHRIARRRHEPPLGEADPPSPAASPLDDVAATERRGLVREALAALPPAGREAAELFYLEGRGCAEVAEALGVPEGTVKRRLHDARGRLRQMLLGLAETPPEPTEKPERPAL
jgi:RNA polymerase sigma factor (sigma-70 family)